MRVITPGQYMFEDSDFINNNYVGSSVITGNYFASPHDWDKPWAYKNLVKIEGDLDMSRGSCTVFPDLETIEGELIIVRSRADSFPKLKDVVRISCYVVPVLPNIRKNTVVVYPDYQEVPVGGNAGFEVSMYASLVREVTSAPVETLALLRAAEPHLAHLIDHILKGGAPHDLLG